MMNIRGIAAAFYLLMCTSLFSQTVTTTSIQDLLINLASKDDAVRLATLSTIESLEDPEISARIFSQYQNSMLYLWKDQVIGTASIMEDSNYNKILTPMDPISGKPLNPEVKTLLQSETQVIKPGRSERSFLASAQILVDLRRTDPTTQINAVRRAALDDRALEMTGFLQEIASQGKGELAFSASESINLIILKNSQDTEELKLTFERLCKMQSLRALPQLENFLTDPRFTSKDPSMEPILMVAIKTIQEYQNWVQAFDIFKSALSSGSILILVALGLSITFGLMGVINMAHGEMLMIGAYTTYCIQLLFGHSAENPAPLFFFVALPASFIVSALAGGLIEWAVIKRLYRRPIESLLASYGVSLILIQIIRLIFGDNRATNSPLWLQGALEIAQGMSIPVNRLFIFALALASIAGIWLLFRFTRLGLDMKATMQNREMAASMGINTRRVDNLTFMLGSGIAGIAGFALTTVGGITPDMGKNYIVDSFLVVVTGGVGNMAGVVSSGMGIGFINKILEGTFFGAVWAKILVLAMVITFIQFKPRGLFAPKGRHSDD